eukprot:Anaeramoba_flamelloidesa84979_70.p2 GENE.a84979_70~~a84979_70.p2  ORF type:complete len:194 (-),score=61.07 a84979_70:96-677(-)
MRNFNRFAAQLQKDYVIRHITKKRYQHALKCLEDLFDNCLKEKWFSLIAELIPQMCLIIEESDEFDLSPETPFNFFDPRIPLVEKSKKRLLKNFEMMTQNKNAMPSRLISNSSILKFSLLIANPQKKIFLINNYDDDDDDGSDDDDDDDYDDDDDEKKKKQKKEKKKKEKKRKNEIGRARVGKECRSRWSPYH